MAKPHSVEVRILRTAQQQPDLTGVGEATRVRFIRSDRFHIDLSWTPDGRIRIDGSEPIVVEPLSNFAVLIDCQPEFSPQIDTTDEPTRLWVDGKGRFIIEHPARGVFTSFKGAKPRFLLEGRRTQGMRFNTKLLALASLKLVHAAGGTCHQAYVNELGSENKKAAEGEGQ